MFICVIWNIPRVAELRTCYMTNGTEVFNACDDFENYENCELDVCPTELRLNLSYCRDYILIGNFIMMVLLPFILISTLNGCIFHYIRTKRISINKVRQNSHQTVGAIFLVIVLAFSVCNIPRVVTNTYEVNTYPTTGYISISFLTLKVKIIVFFLQVIQIAFQDDVKSVPWPSW